MTVEDDKQRVALDLADNNELKNALTMSVDVDNNDNDNDNDEEDDDSSRTEQKSPSLSRDQITALCSQLHTVFRHVDDMTALDDMIEFYEKELVHLRQRRSSLNTATANVAADEMSDCESNESSSTSNGNATEMIPLLK